MKQQQFTHSTHLAGIMCSLLVLIPPAASAAQTGWAHQLPGLQSNGEIIIKSLNGGTYLATQNPTGALVKASQNAATQPPTLLMQVAMGGARECQPKINSSSGGNASMPACSAGYTSIFQQSAPLSSYSCPAPGSDTFNIGGTNWSFGLLYVANAQVVGFMNDNKPSGNSGNLPTSSLYATCAYSSLPYSWAANLCCK